MNLGIISVRKVNSFELTVV